MTDQPPGVAARRTARLLVGAQFALLATLAGLPRRSDWPVSAGLRRAGIVVAAGGAGIAALGSTELGRGLTAVPLPNEHAELRTGGLFRLVRHPIYSGVLMAATGRTLMLGNRWAVVALAALMALLHGKSRFEERHLATRFPGYAEYAARTPRFIPAVHRHDSLARRPPDGIPTGAIDRAP